MSRLVCTCGHVIRDVTDGLSCKAELLPDQDAGRLWKIIDALSEFIEARERGYREQWIRERLAPGFRTDRPDGDVVSAVIAATPLGPRRTLYECAECGTLWVQVETGANRYQGYSPHEGNIKGILSSLAERSEG